MPLDSIADLERRIRRLEMELDQYKHKFVAPDRTVKTEPPLAHIDHGSLAGLGDNDHPQYLLTTGKAADSDKLDGVDGTGYVNTSAAQTIAGVKTFSSIPVLPSTNPTLTNHAVRKGYADATYLNISAKAADSNLLDGIDSTGFLKTSDSGVWTSFTPTYTGWTSGTVTGTFKYSVIGNIVFLLIDMAAGTSNSTFADINLPVNADLNANYGGANALAINNGVTLSVATRWFIGGTSQVISFRTDMATGLWTASGTKRVRCLAIYAKGA